MMETEIPTEWDVEKTEEDYEHEDSPSLEFEILNYPADTTLKGYLQQQKDGVLKIPTFQRRFVWDQVKASKLIESFLIGLPVPGVFLYKPRAGHEYQVIDGHQRITSVTAYLLGTIGEKKFRLKGVAKRWDGCSFDELTEEDRFKLEQSVMRATIIQQLDPMDDRSIYMIFERLNTGGVNLNPMEVRRCVYNGPFIESLDELNGDKNWRACIAKPVLDKRYRDVELIVRVLAFYERLSSYEKPMKGFLSNYTADKRSNQIDDDTKQRFFAACKTVVEALGEKPFHLRGRLNYGALDSVLSVLMASQASPDSLAFKALFQDSEFQVATSSNTSDRSEIETRVYLTQKFLA